MPELPAQLSTDLAPLYELQRELGRGGMATVYLARDTRHDRLVAVKVLHPDLAASVGAERFLAEIRLTARLQHPSILPLFDSGESNGLLYYVMPYVAGETLRARLDRERQLPVADAVRMATAIASALEHAHKLGVIHRDIKPENILLHDGDPLVSDFGIALAVRRAMGERLTQSGMSVGTPQYMSPEQATGDRLIDPRSDIFALGCMLYEMLAGEMPFAAPTAQATIARILADQPRDLRALRPTVPVPVAAAIARSLEKLPADRFSSAQEFSHALHDVSAERIAAVAAPAPRRWNALPWGLAVAGVITAVAALAFSSRSPSPSLSGIPVIRIPIVADDSAQVMAANTAGIPFAVSADERHIVYAGPSPRGRRLYVRSLNETEPRALVGTEGGTTLHPTFSPDGKWIAYLLDRRFLRIPFEGGRPITIFEVNRGDMAGASWFHDDSLIVSRDNALMIAPVQGGAPVLLSRPDTAAGETGRWGPHAIGSHLVAFISVSRDGIAANRVGMLSRETGRTVISQHLGTTVLGAVDDRLLWVMISGAIAAARFDADGNLGQAMIVGEGVLVRPGGAAKAALSGGSLLYEHGEQLSRLVVVSRTGVVTPFSTELGAYSHPRWSPDGSRLAIVQAKAGGSDIWVIDAATKAATRLTAEGQNASPAWTPDGARLLYRSMKEGRTTIEWRRADGSDEQTTLVQSNLGPYQAFFSPDSRWLTYRTSDASRPPRHLMVSPAESIGAFRDISSPGAMEFGPTISPDGRWLASVLYQDDSYNVFVRPFPAGAPAYRISTGSAVEPTWAPDGRTIYYRQGNATMAAAVTTSPTVAVTGTRKLFEGSFLADFSNVNYDLMPDGSGFLMIQPTESRSKTVLVWGWASELRAQWSEKK